MVLCDKENYGETPARHVETLRAGRPRVNPLCREVRAAAARNSSSGVIPVGLKCLRAGNGVKYQKSLISRTAEIGPRGLDMILNGHTGAKDAQT